MELSMFSVSISCCLIWIVWKVYSILTDPFRKIPGPDGLPFFGNVLQIDGGRAHMEFMDLAKTYGPLFKISIFNSQQIVVNSLDLIWEVIVTKSQEFSGRPLGVRSKAIAKDNLFFSEGQEMNIKKKMIMKAMKSYGSGLGDMEELLSSASSDFMTHLESKVGRGIDMVKEFTSYVCTITGVLTYGKKFNPESETIKGMTELTYMSLQVSSPVDNSIELESFPWLRYIPVWNARYIKVEKAVDELKSRTCHLEMKKAFREYESGTVHNEGLVHKIIHAVRTELDKYGRQVVSDSFIEGMLIDMLIGGIETTSRTMTQLLLELVKSPEVTRNIQKEIDDVIGRNREPRLSDRSHMPYTSAVLHEIQRLVSIAPVIPHKTVTDVILGGYRIPKNTPVMVNYWSVTHDEHIYPDPYKFLPERFLDEDGSLKEASDAVRKSSLTFGAGARVCVGELFAKSRMFLTTVSMLQRFNLELCDKNINSDVKTYRMHLQIVTPRNVRMILRTRK